MKKSKIGFIVGLIMGCSVASRAEVPSLSLRIGDALPPGHIVADSLLIPWVNEVKNLSDGKITARYYPAEQAAKAKDLLSVTQDGILDMSYIAPAYVSDKMPLSDVAALPGGEYDACILQEAYWTMIQEGGVLYEEEFKPNDIHPILLFIYSPYGLAINVEGNYNSLDSLKGLKIRGAGGPFNMTLEALGMVPVNIPAPEIYEGLSRGTLDGTVAAFPSAPSYKMEKFNKTDTDNIKFGAFVATYSMGLKKWNGLSDDVKIILNKAADHAMAEACKNFNLEIDRVRKIFVDQGTKFIEFSPEDMTKLDDVFGEVRAKWAERLDSRGKAGSDILAKFEEAVRDAEKNKEASKGN